MPVFVFFEDGSGLEVFRSLDRAQGWVEAIDVSNGEYTFMTVDGRAVEASVGGQHDQEVQLRITDQHVKPLLCSRLAAALPVVGLPAALAGSPTLAAKALAEKQWRAPWPQRPVWVHRRLRGFATRMVHVVEPRAVHRRPL